MKPKIDSVKNLIETDFLNMYEIEYKNKLGNKKKWNSVSRVKTKEYSDRLYTNKTFIDAVLIAAYHIEEKKLVLIKQYRVPINQYIYEIPAGLIDKNEDIEQCVKRELSEETGLELLEIKSVFNNVYLSPGITDECSSIVFCTCKGNISYNNLEEDEDLTIHLIKQEDIDNIILTEEKTDLKTLFVMQMFKKLGKNFWL